MLISICIPAFKRAEYLKRLLDSISIQSYKDFEVIITDDSNDNSVADLIPINQKKFSLIYKKNKEPLGSPENWNEAIRHAQGQWIKLMHDDDWFTNENSLQEFADTALKFTDSSFIFSGYCEIDILKNKKHEFVINNFHLKLLRKSPLNLFKRNFIGHPSTTLIKREYASFYDPNFKWVVDFEFYIRYLIQKNGLVSIRKPLINIGLNEFQITKRSFRNPAIEIPEVIRLYYKLPPKSLRNIFVYDYYWRFIRNLSIRTLKDIREYILDDIPIPKVIQKMIKMQSNWSHQLLKNGVISKSLMFFSYLMNYSIL
jgi:glycosyltransferase involved in cell wall biosynthesis